MPVLLVLPFYLESIRSKMGVLLKCFYCFVPAAILTYSARSLINIGNGLSTALDLVVNSGIDTSDERLCNSKLDRRSSLRSVLIFVRSVLL